MTINWGDWTQMPDYRQFIDQNKHKSVIGALAQQLDPSTYIPGVNQITNPIHEAAQAGIETGNQVLSPVVKAAHQVTDFITPGLKQVRDSIPAFQNIQNFSENKPIDTAGIIAGTIFSGGAGASVADSAAGAGAGAGAGAAGGGSSLGAYGGAAAGALEKGAFSGAADWGTAAGTSLGAFGGQAAGGLESGTFNGISEVANPGLLNSLKSAYSAAQPFTTAKNVVGNLNQFAGPNLDALGTRAQQNQLAERIRADQTNPELPNTPNTKNGAKKRIVDQIMQQQQFFGRGF